MCQVGASSIILDTAACKLVNLQAVQYIWHGRDESRAIWVRHSADHTSTYAAIEAEQAMPLHDVDISRMTDGPAWDNAGPAGSL